MIFSKTEPLLKKLLKRLNQAHDPKPADAKQLLSDDVFVAAYARLMEDLTAELAATQPHDTAGRERKHAEVHALNRVVYKLNELAHADTLDIE